MPSCEVPYLLQAQYWPLILLETLYTQTHIHLVEVLIQKSLLPCIDAAAKMTTLYVRASRLLCLSELHFTIHAHGP